MTNAQYLRPDERSLLAYLRNGFEEFRRLHGHDFGSSLKPEAPGSVFHGTSFISAALYVFAGVLLMIGIGTIS